MKDIIDFFKDEIEEDGIYAIVFWILVGIGMLLIMVLIIYLPYKAISRNNAENAYVESVIVENNGEYTFTETEKWETGILVDEYSRSTITQPVIIGKFVSIRTIPSEYSLTVTYEDITEEIYVEEDIWEKYCSKIGEEIPVLVYKKYLNDELIMTELKEIQ